MADYKCTFIAEGREITINVTAEDSASAIQSAQSYANTLISSDTLVGDIQFVKCELKEVDNG